MTSNQRSLGIVVPAYRPDWGRLSAYLDELTAALRPTTLRVEIDAPSDEDRARAHQLEAEVHVADERRGKGGALTDGFDALDTELVGFVDADGSTSAASFADVVGALEEGADVAAGSRRVPGAQVEQRSLHRNVLGRGLSWLARRMLAVRLEDYQCGAKALTREAWTAIRPDLRQRGFAWDLDVLAMAHATGLEIREVPIRWRGTVDSSVDLVPAVREFLGALVDIRRRAEAKR